MRKEGVSVTLDEALLKCLRSICSKGFKPKLSTVVNSFLKEHPEIKKRLKKNGK